MKKRIIALLLCICLVGSMTVYAVDPETEETIPETQVEEVVEETKPVSRGNSGLISKKVEDVTIGDFENIEAALEAETLDAKEYIYFDLYYGDVKFTSGTYSGYGLNGVAISGTHTATNQYYICQSNGDPNLPRDENNVPQYSRVTYDGKSWGEYITNNTNVLEVISAWNAAAAAVNRSETPAEIKTNKNTVEGNTNVNVLMHHRIDISSAESVTTHYDITLDNIWSGFHNDDCKDANGDFYKQEYIKDGPHYRTSGGLSFRPQNKTTTADIRLIGDNRFGNIHYEVGSGAGGTVDDNGYCDVNSIDTKIEQMFFHDASTDGTPATLTVANLGGDNGYNHFCSVIGGSNNPDYVPGLVFKSGVIYAGATELDNCTAIGGGGCGFGGVTIYGGTITAVTATNGAAIGGGIGDGSNGGAADIEIKGGTVYAYNKGLAIEGTRESNGQNGTISGQVIYAAMPAVAIGSGSSRRQWTVPARINISGGTVYAQSVGGTAIGGGSSVNYQGADALVNISNGANVTAKSVSGNVTVIHEYDFGITPTYVGRTEFISASTSIGGGTAGVPFRVDTAVSEASTLRQQGNGGTAVLNISGDDTKIYAGSIGGGGVNTLKEDPFPDSVTRPAGEGKIGAALVTISGGTVQGQVIMAKGGTADCSFNMTGGTIDNSTKDDTFTFLKENGGAVCIENGVAMLSAGTIKNASAVNGGAIYITDGTFTMNGGAISENEAQNGGGVYIEGGTCNLNAGTISNNHASEDGGAVYVQNTSVTFGGDNGIRIENNTADGNAGALYLNQNSQPANAPKHTTTIATGQIYNNTANGNGGAIYLSGEYGSCEVTGSSELKSNSAANGGGLYITSGASLHVSGGSICYNKALGQPAAGVTTAYNDSDNCGVGGGIYVGQGAESFTSSFEMDQSDEAANKIVGIFGNTADFAADDVFANKLYTNLQLPDVASMKLGEGINATGWYEDYANGDTMYSAGTCGNVNHTIVKAERYRGAMNTYPVNVSEINSDGKYICLTIGVTAIGYGTITITKSGNDVADDQVFIFHVESYEMENGNLPDQKIEFDVYLVGKGSITIENVPYGKYKISEYDSWRFTEPEPKDVIITTGNVVGNVNFENNRNNDKWLDGTAVPVVNVAGHANLKGGA